MPQPALGTAICIIDPEFAQFATEALFLVQLQCGSAADPMKVWLCGYG